MNKTELIAAVAEKCAMKKKDAELAVTATFEAITEELVKGGKIQLIGFGSFEVKSRAERVGRNPKTGETIKIDAVKYPVFKAGKGLKDEVAK
ncbi:MAG: HU family DNA-binding protein [Clostridia bacterium]|nr:HU family DNA-binding protein [Clostridia bacterium]MBR4955482.1 HU family DNA-binding protein [Clostridia bacterium]